MTLTLSGLRLVRRGKIIVDTPDPMPEEQKLGFTHPVLCDKLHEVVVGYKSLIHSISTHDAEVVRRKAAELETLAHNLAHA